MSNDKNLAKIVSGITLILPISLCSIVVEAKETINYPNVVFIMADDLGIGDLGCYGQKQIKTPAIDKLASNGIKFMQHYCGATVSAPSRCVFLTGKHTGHSYIRGNKGYTAEDGRKYDLNIPNEEITVAEIFKQANYTTACCGKWGLGGPNAVGHPNNQGFDYFFGYLGQGNAHNYYPSQLFENNTPIILNGETYSHDLIMNKALDFIDNNSESPFFLFLTPTIPHADLIVPDNEYMGYENKFCEKPFPGKGYRAQDKPQAAFAGMIARLDRDVQRVVDLLEKKGISENTIVIFTSDNGTHREGGHNPESFDSNGPYRGNKRDLYDGGIHAPFIVKWPAIVTEPRVSYHLSSFWDFMPTICEMIDVKKPADIDGVSYLPTITGKGKQKTSNHLYFEFHEEGGKQAVIKDGWKLIKLNVNNSAKTKYELYSLPSDPAEIGNVVAMYPKKVKELTKLMDSSRTTNENWKFAFEK